MLLPVLSLFFWGGGKEKKGRRGGGKEKGKGKNDLGDSH